jgi:hypothetical protein
MTLQITWALLTMLATIPEAEQLRVHDKKESKQLVRSATDRLAHSRRAHPPVHRVVVDAATGAHLPVTEIWEDLVSPLLGQVCTLRVRFEGVSVRDHHDGIDRPSDSAADPHVLECSIKAIFDGLLELKDIYPDDAEDVAVASSRVENLSDEIKQIKKEKKRLRKRSRTLGSLISVGDKKPITLPRRRVTQRNAPRFSPSYLRLPNRGGKIKTTLRTGEAAPGKSRDCSRAPRVRSAPDGTYDKQQYAEEGPSGYRRREREAKLEREELRDRRGNILRAYRDELAHARHELSLSLPRGFELPDRPPKMFDVVALIEWVGWDHAVDLPTLIIKGKLLSSGKLGLFPNSHQTRPEALLPAEPPL